MERKVLEIVSFTDPYCTWCWGSEPILRKIQEVYGKQVSISFVMGGLVEDIRNFSDPGAGIGGEQWYKQVAEHWAEASRHHNMPVDVEVYYDIKDDVFSTYPACIAFEAAKLQSEEMGKLYLRRLREAAAAERMAIQHSDVQVALADEIGLNRDIFLENIQSKKAENAFREDIAECLQRGVRGFPSFLLRGFGEEILLRGYTPYQTFDNWFRELSKNQLEQKELQAGVPQVFDFISRYGKIAPIEVACVYDMAFEDAQKLLKQMTKKGIVS
ncbi:DsbA family protein [Candidatus Marithioploca araucensis]|uniref:DsbA family protein n=1 Tax=Candidatus Marithioploca araucensis TaxID=70273 RepID=A0ABT7VSE0_9GAMM|nr:DsbA family protein [Candidatus Marithioploca araucensis]